MANDYKRDGNKPPVLDALVPFYPALEALVRCMDDMQHKHRLAGSSDPFNQWRHLPNAKTRLANAAARHWLRGPWNINTADGNHTHGVHALFGVLAAVTLHELERRAATNRPGHVCGARGFGLGPDDYCEACNAEKPKPAQEADFAPIIERARIELALQGEHQGQPLGVPAGADLRERPQRPPERSVLGQYWTGDSGTWHCVCGAGRPSACICSRANGDHS